ncbi:MAG TPA: signal recognition particle protein [Candidatus Anaerofilum excrementigallinarum]|nr:signal recognition particle protein [Candidatus Anaerofilum excrementigallinarum]
MAFESLSEKLNQVFKKLRGKGKLSESDIKAAMREVRMALLEADVNYKVAKDFIAAVTEKAMGQEVMESLTPAQQVIKIVHEELCSLMGGEAERVRIKSKPPTVILMCGLQGSGKTTHSAKLGKYFKKEGHHPLLAACDVYRPAAIDQLCIVGEKAGVPVFQLGQEKPEVIAKKAYAYAKDHGNDILILDTAGRLHIDEELMAELGRIREAVEVDEALLVIDAMAGQDAVNVAKTFNEAVGVDGIILTKLDGDTRGGAALSARQVTGKPIKFVGVGEKLDDLELFHPERMASRILGMGDVLTLIEKAQETQDLKKAEETARRMMENKFDLNDMLDQFAQMKKMGGAAGMLSMLPGGNQIDPDQIDESIFTRMEAIIQSMTPAERAKPSIIDPKRKRRIAAGSGTKVEDVNRLLKQFEQMSKLLKQIKKSPRAFGRRFGLGRRR